MSPDASGDTITSFLRRSSSTQPQFHRSCLDTTNFEMLAEAEAPKVSEGPVRVVHLVATDGDIVGTEAGHCMGKCGAQ